MSTFTHTPRPPHVSEAPHHLQRRFGPPNCRSSWPPEPVEPKTEKGGLARVTVYRSGNEDTAELEFKMGLQTQVSFDVRMAPSELRDLAARLLDAAHDIETNPAAKLMEAQAAERAAA